MDFGMALLTVLRPLNLFFITIGVLGGIVVGAIPGLTATLAISLLIPFTFGMDPVPALIMLIGIYCGGIYGGSITAILIHTPGTPGAAATVLDGYPLAQQGKAGKALGIAVIASFIGGTISAVIMIFLSPIISSWALKFSSAEYFSLALFGLTVIFSISEKSILKGTISGMFGLLLSTVGLDYIVPYARFTFGIDSLIIGFPILPAIIGLFAVTEVLRLFEKPDETIEVPKIRLKGVIPTWDETKKLIPIYLKSSLIGTFIGALPGTGANIASFISYGEARRCSKTPENFGTGMIEGVAASEAANNAVTGGALIPMLTLGIPGDAVTAVLLGALTIQGLQPGPLLFREHMDVINPLFSGLIVANIIMLLAGLFGAMLFARIASLKRRLLIPLVAIFSLLGAFAAEGSFAHMLIAFGFGIVGYFLNRNGFPLAPIALSLILGPIAETSFRTALIRSQGSISIFFTRPISLVFIALSILSVLIVLIRRNVKIFKKKKNN